CLFFFFFQAEDGIRDRNVTGVQTCALPIYLRGDSPTRHVTCAIRTLALNTQSVPPFGSTLTTSPGSGPDEFHELRLDRRVALVRSEERRVGKECRYWWSLAH